MYIHVYTLNPVESNLRNGPTGHKNRPSQITCIFVFSIHMHAHTLTHNGSEALGGSLLLSSDWINIRNQ